MPEPEQQPDTDASIEQEPTSLLGGDQPQKEPSKEVETADGTEPEQEEEPQGPPENYELVFPETMQVDEQMLGEAQEMFRADGLSNEQAQRYADLMAKKVDEIGQAFASHRMAQGQEWAQQAQTDQEIGGAQFDESVSLASKALDAFGSPELRKALDESQMGNHPEMIKAFARIGKEIKEDNISPPGLGGGQQTKSKILYPNQN